MLNAQALRLFIMRSGQRTVVGKGVSKEWKAYALPEALKMLGDMRVFPGWKAGYLSYDLGALWQGVFLRPRRKWSFEFTTPLLHFVAPEEVRIYDEGSFDWNELSIGGFFQATPPQQDLSYARYRSCLQKVHKALIEGETYELNFAHRFHGSFEGLPLEVFRRLHEANPSPHACYLNFDPVTVVSCSPERLVEGKIVKGERRVEDGRMRISTRPIKGTVPRGRTSEEDAKFIRELLKSKKNEAELNMIVDLARNDLGRVCEVGSVEVSNHRAVETYSHVHHTVSTVEGVLCDGMDWLDVLKALFPGGSITGAPKVRTMELIDALEPCARGVYTGSAGWISPEGEFDFNILIRTIAFSKARPKGRYSFHSGGAIVVDSKAREEYEETLVKASALVDALR